MNRVNRTREPDVLFKQKENRRLPAALVFQELPDSGLGKQGSVQLTAGGRVEAGVVRGQGNLSTVSSLPLTNH